MKRQAVTTSACLFISSILLGFLLASRYGFTASVSVLGAVCLVAGTVWEICRQARRKSSTSRTFLRQHKVKRLAPCIAALVIAGWVYGACEAPASTLSAAWLGHRVQVRGRVESVFPGHNGYTAYVRTSSLQRDGTEIRCVISMRWLTKSTPVRKGYAVVLQGTLMVADHSSSLLTKSSAAKTGVPYEFMGTALSITPAPEHFADRVQAASLQLIDESHSMSSQQATLAYSMMFGGTNLDAATKQAFLSAGLLHVLAASGANLMILESTAALPLRVVWRSLRLPRFWWYVQLLALIWCFAGACRFDASVVRAACMSSYRLIGEWTGRRATLFGGLVTAGVVLTLAAPDLMISASSILSFAATAALAYALHGRQAPPQAAFSRVRRLAYGCWMYISRLAKSTTLVELSVAPVTIIWFHQWAPYSVISNLFVDPLLIVLLPCTAVWMGILWTATVVPLPGGLGSFLGHVTSYLLNVLMAWVNFISGQPFALLTLPDFPGWIVIPYFVLLWQGFRLRRKVRRTSQ